PEANAVLLRHSRSVGATVYWVGDGPVGPLGLAGRYQQENARLALLAVELLRTQGWRIPEDAVREGLRDVHWPGRLEIVAGQPLTVVDGAHNPAAAQALAVALAEEGFLARRPCILVLGASADKDLQGLLRPLVPLADWVVTTRAVHHRAVDERKLAELVRAEGVAAVPARPVAEALRLAREEAGAEGFVCVTGSFFVVAEAREALGLAVREPWPEPVQGSLAGQEGDAPGELAG
ncbi:MAG: glutamate ligase domain-containing protein, partial [Chloroflexia bacterium]